MTDETRSDLPSSEGAPAPQKSEAPKNTVAPSKEAASTQFVAPPVTPFPTLPPTPTPSVPSAEPEWDAEGSIEISDDDYEGAVGHDENRKLKHWRANLPSAWAQGPGQFEVLVEGCKLIVTAAKAAGQQMSVIEAVVAKALPKVNMVLVAGAKAGAPGSVEVWDTGTGAISFTISDILREAGMQVPSGVRQLFPVKAVSKSPIGPAIAINLGAKPLASHRVETKRKKKST